MIRWAQRTESPARASLPILLIVLASLLSGCMFGVGQAMVLPPVRGNWTFSGMDVTVRSSAAGNRAEPWAIRLQEPGRSGVVDQVLSPTQVLVGWDFPRFRFGIAGGVSGNVSVSQLDLVYKHPLSDDFAPRWRLLAGLARAGASVSQTFEQKLALGADVELASTADNPDGGTLRNGDTVRITAAEEHAGWYAVFGVEGEIYEWLHGFVQMYGRLSSETARTQGVTLPVHAGGGVTEAALFSDDRFATDVRQQPALSAPTVQAPEFTALVGIALTWPTVGMIRRWVAGPGADRPAGMRAPAGPPPSRQPSSVPAPSPSDQGPPPPDGPESGPSHPPEGWPSGPNPPDPPPPPAPPQARTLT